jgi:hypothetical protein
MPENKSHKIIDKIAVLRTTDLFGKASESVLSQAAARAVVRRLKAGEILFFRA